jgi:hypothetical protein
MAKFGMSMCVLGMAEEFKNIPIAVNALWPQKLIHTAASDMLHGNESDKFARKADIMADAAYAILIKEPTATTGNFYIDEGILKENGITDLKPYACNPAYADQLIDCFFDDSTEYSSFKKYEEIAKL